MGSAYRSNFYQGTAEMSIGAAVPGSLVGIGSRVSPGGAQGIQGEQGEKGFRGTQWLRGLVPPDQAVTAADALPNDWFINTATWDVYQLVGGTWANRGTIKGDQGIQGVAGATWLQGTSNPASGTGVVNDWYVNTSSWEVFQKTGATTWTSRGYITGTTWLQGTAAPSNSTGIINDWFLDTNTWNVYQKTGASTWTHRGNIKGDINLPAGTIVAFGGSAAPLYWLVCDGAAVSRTTYAALFAVIGTTYGTGNGSTTFNLPDLRSRAPVGIGPMDGTSTHNFTLGLKYGSPTHVLSENEMPHHAHMVNNHTHNYDFNHHHSVWVNAHGHGDPTHQHGGPGYYMQFGQGGVGGWGWLEGQGTRLNGMWLAGCGLHNAGNMGGGTAWVSEMAANWHYRATEGSTPATDYRGGNVAHNNCQPSLGVNFIIKT